MANTTISPSLPGERVRGEAPSDRGWARAILARRVIVWGLVCTYALFFSIVTVVRHRTLGSGTFDLAFMDQALWSTLRGNLLGVSIEPHLATSELGYHFEPILIPLAALYLLYSSPETLLVLQSVVLALGALPASWLAYDRLGSNVAAVVFAAAYVLFPGLQAANMFDFHAFTLSASFLLFAFYFIVKQRYGWFAVFAVLAMSTKENVPLTVAMFGLYILIVQRRPRPGLITIAGAAVWFFLAAYVIIPAYNNESQGWLWNRYGGMGGSPLDIVLFLITHPERLLEPAPGLSNLAYVTQLLFPVAFLSLLSPLTLALAAPGLATNLLTVYEPMHLLETYHYTSSLVPVVIASAIYGLGTISDLLRRRKVPATGVVWLLSALVLATSLVYHYYRGYTPLSPSFSFSWPDEHHAAAQRIIASIPADAAVAAQWNLGAHVSQRHQFTMFGDIEKAEYVLLDAATQPNSVGFDKNIHEQFRNVVESPDFGVVAAEDGVILLQRGAPRRALPDEFYSFARVDGPVQPSHPLRIQFGDALELIGFDLHPGRDARLDVTYYWRALRPIEEDLLLATYLTDGNGGELGATEHPQAADFWYPTSRWQPGEVVRVDALRLPWDPGDMDFGLAVGVVAGADPWDVGRRLAPRVLECEWEAMASGSGSLVEIVRVTNDRGLVRPVWPPRPTLAETGPAVASFGGIVNLTAYELKQDKARPGGTAVVELSWQVEDRAETSLTAFVHLLAPGPTLVAQRDSPPLGGRFPTTFWQPGDAFVDAYELSLPEDLPAGEYAVAVGFYDPLTGQRVEVVRADGERADHLILGEPLRVSAN